ncbi:hypothetical protein HanHA300_Chr15g0583051 [Helianthus annuus]|nr:hypothetical protein HanHA300_Chr15g0583051 [Helianthus annuus]KAJ0474706.1 hypothetical protein HanHA89_Chr15g0632821 [Helianthus annuus]KAJ0650261.1 hypothetical protein HanLR1_Chr15g0593731 [Helianthus annuus]
METSLRYGGDSSALRINTIKKPPTVRYAGDTSSALRVHAKQKFRIDSNILLQVASFLHHFPISYNNTYIYTYWMKERILDLSLAINLGKMYVVFIFYPSFMF